MVAKSCQSSPTPLVVPNPPIFRRWLPSAGFGSLLPGALKTVKTLLDVVPEIASPGFVDLLEKVVTTGEPFIGREVLITFANRSGQGPEDRHVDFVYQPLTGIPLLRESLMRAPKLMENLPLPGGLLDYGSIWTSWLGAVKSPVWKKK